MSIKEIQEIKHKIVNNLIIEIQAQDTLTMEAGLISGASVDVEIENFEIAPDGVLEYDVKIMRNITPNAVPKEIYIDI